MRRLYPRQIQDKLYLSRLLEQYLDALQTSPLQVRLKALSWDSQIPETIFHRLMELHRHPADAPNIEAEDFHVLFSNIMFRFPTVRLWLQDDGEVFIEMWSSYQAFADQIVQVNHTEVVTFFQHN